jgi:threonine/homoserine/homoserine lactone efflux protein
MNLLTYFFIAFVLSALGSMPIGMITLKVAEKTIHDGYRSGVMISLGATVIEFSYTYIALVSMDFFIQNVGVNLYINLIAMMVFFTLGFYHLLRKTKTILDSDGEYKTSDFVKGIVLASMNMLIIPFWIFLAVWLKNYGFEFATTSQILIFSIGSALGALVIFLLYTRLGKLVVSKIQKVSYYTNRTVGLIFLLLAMYQLTQLF